MSLLESDTVTGTPSPFSRRLSRFRRGEGMRAERAPSLADSVVEGRQGSLSSPWIVLIDASGASQSGLASAWWVEAEPSAPVVFEPVASNEQNVFVQSGVRVAIGAQVFFGEGAFRPSDFAERVTELFDAMRSRGLSPGKAAAMESGDVQVVVLGDEALPSGARRKYAVLSVAPSDSEPLIVLYGDLAESRSYVREFGWDELTAAVESARRFVGF